MEKVSSACLNLYANFFSHIGSARAALVCSLLALILIYGSLNINQMNEPAPKAQQCGVNDGWMDGVIET